MMQDSFIGVGPRLGLVVAIFSRVVNRFCYQDGVSKTLILLKTGLWPSTSTRLELSSCDRIVSIRSGVRPISFIRLIHCELPSAHTS